MISISKESKHKSWLVLARLCPHNTEYFLLHIVIQHTLLTYYIYIHTNHRWEHTLNEFFEWKLMRDSVIKHRMKITSQAKPTPLLRMQIDANKNLDIQVLFTNILSPNVESSTQRSHRFFSHTRWYIAHLHGGGSNHESPLLDYPQTLICMELHPTR